VPRSGPLRGARGAGMDAPWGGGGGPSVGTRWRMLRVGAGRCAYAWSSACESGSDAVWMLSPFSSAALLATSSNASASAIKARSI
jgi:hypothetical protein